MGWDLEAPVFFNEYDSTETVKDPFIAEYCGTGHYAMLGYVIVDEQEDLYEEAAEGDEPEPLEVVPKKLLDLEELTYTKDLTEARSILALYMARDIINSRKE